MVERVSETEASAILTALFSWLAWRSWSKAQAELRAHVANYGPLGDKHSPSCRSSHDAAGPLFILWLALAVTSGISALIGA